MTEEQKKEFEAIFKNLANDSLEWLSKRTEQELYERQQVLDKLEEKLKNG